jgi:hypothetical protein
MDQFFAYIKRDLRNLLVIIVIMVVVIVSLWYLESSQQWLTKLAQTYLTLN